MPTYYTVRTPTAADRSAVSSYVEGTDLSGVEFMFAKLLDGVPVPAWEGSAREVEEALAPAASQSALYIGQAGPAYRENSRRFGLELVSGFVSGTGALPAPVLAGLVDHLSQALQSAQAGWISTLRYQLANLGELPPAFTAPVRDALVAQCDDFLQRFPGNAGV